VTQTGAVPPWTAPETLSEIPAYHDQNQMRKVFPLLLVCASFACAQSLSVGLLGGAPFSDIVNSGSVNINSTTFSPTSPHFTIGPAIQVNLPLSLRIEVDALYRPYGLTVSGPQVNQDLSGQQWRFPVLLQYRFHAPLVKPFVSAGFSYEHLSGISSAFQSAITSGPGTLLHQNNVGIVLGAGVDVKVPLVRVSGELRYTRLTLSEFANISDLNQAEVIFGVHF
jgi:hypothetical protein